MSTEQSRGIKGDDRGRRSAHLASVLRPEISTRKLSAESISKMSGKVIMVV